jgi:hypothetical protein
MQQHDEAWPWGQGAGGEKRAVVRYATQFNASLREPGHSSIPVDVFDLSINGCRVVARSKFNVGRKVWLRLPNLDSWIATVVWAERDYAGFKFDAPLDPAVVEGLVNLSGMEKGWLLPQ